ncbi:hypothetical protein L218DRAFT_947781 [Marasmius fiardii PR-910]|nr:hypothetical protein L218DRAFT_947781 [Marasmius fiardii PR-910]
MSTPFVPVALPPGVYNIQIDVTGGITQGVVTPNASGNQFSVADVTSSADQKVTIQFLIDGVGRIRSKDGVGRIRSKESNGEYAYTAISSTPGAKVTRSVSSTRWIINVARNNDGSYTGYIMTNDNKDLYWSLNGSKVNLQAIKQSWNFVPV